jgi:ABC-2 type transport system ATP-binding protein
VTTAVDIQGVSKRFRLYHRKYTSLKERVIHAGRTPYTDLWALSGISFEVKEGETVGILGRNGSGKSTLLKCICGVLQPTEGQVIVRGKLAGLLELGAGFQPDLSGRQNIYLNGSLLGIPKSDINRVFDEIVAFAELEQFIDQQVKFYSSGMYVRLGFAVAVNVDPDVLVIDEVLAVGDERFQRKCLERVRQFQEQGRTIIFVTQSPDQVRAICDEGVVLSEGHMIGHGPPGEVVRVFRENLLEAGEVLGQALTLPVAPAEVPAIGETEPGRPVRITGVTISYPGSGERPYVMTGEPLTIQIQFSSSEWTVASFIAEVRDDGGNILVRTTSTELDVPVDVVPGTGAVSFHYEAVPFTDGTYDLSVGVEHRAGGNLSDWKEGVARIKVMNPSKNLGLLVLPAKVTVEQDAAAVRPAVGR